MRIRSGDRVAARPTASSPVLASPTTSISGVALSSAWMPWRKRGWSSAIRTRSGSIAFLRSFLPCDGKPGVDSHPSPRKTLHDTYATKLCSALPHRHQPYTGEAFWWHTHAVVTDHHLQTLYALRRRELNHAG